MLEANKKRLDWLQLKSTVILPIGLSVLLVTIFIFSFIKYYWLQKERANEFQKSSKFSVVGIFKGSAAPRGGSLCFFEVEGATEPIRCSNEVYYIGQKINLTKIVNKSGNFYYIIGHLPLTPHSNGTPNGAP